MFTNKKSISLTKSAFSNALILSFLYILNISKIDAVSDTSSEINFNVNSENSLVALGAVLIASAIGYIGYKIGPLD